VYFYSIDSSEPPHVHVRRENATCKYWLNPLALTSNHGFSARDLNQIRTIILEHSVKINEAWNEHCGDEGAADT
jgi:hypothetical protein